jgi:hypothetical protein
LIADFIILNLEQCSSKKPTKNFLLKIIKNIELNPGNIKSKLPIYRNIESFVKILQDNILYYNNGEFSFLLNIFKDYFSNFEINKQIVKVDIKEEIVDTKEVDRILLIKTLLSSKKSSFNKTDIDIILHKLTK